MVHSFQHQALIIVSEVSLNVCGNRYIIDYVDFTATTSWLVVFS